MNDFFNFDVSTGNQYTKLQSGENKLRILSNILGGFEGWFQGKPVRFRQDYKITADEYAALDKDTYDSSRSKWRPFGVCIVWNYATNSIQIWQFTQKAIIGAIQSLGTDTDWGDVSNYDIKITKTGSGTDTRYEIKPVAPKPVSEDIRKAFADSGLNPSQTFLDSRNIENVDNFHKAVNASNPENIPF